MLTRLALLCLATLAMTPGLGFAQSTSPSGVRTLNPPGAIKAEGTWSLGVRAGDFVFVAGMQGVDPATNRLVPDPESRIRQAFLNLGRFAALVDKVQAELWGNPPYPPRTMVEVRRLFDDDIVEIDSVFYAPPK